MFPAFTQLSAVDWLELEKNALTCQEHDTDAPRFRALRYCSALLSRSVLCKATKKQQAC